MKRHHKFYIVDVFTRRKYAGNQLAVVLDAEDITDEEMQEITREFNFSETTFVTGKNEDGYRVRIFTPSVGELPFAGHPTLGTAYVIQKEIVKKKIEMIKLNLKVGPIHVSFAYKNGQADALWMRQKAASFGPTLNPEPVREWLGLGSNDIDTRFPIQEVSTGVPFTIVPLRTLQAVKNCKRGRSSVASQTINRFSDILVFAPETYDKANQLNVRVFFGKHGEMEDAATGSANGCLAAYLANHGYFGTDKIDLRVEQGYEINRPSLLMLKAQGNADPIEPEVGGTVVNVAEGELA